MSDPTVIVDAGPLVALLNRDDSFHGWAAEAARSLPSPFVSSEAAITEVCFLLQRERLSLDPVFALLDEQLVIVAFDLQTNASALASLIRKFGRLPKGGRMSLADASLVRLAEIHDRASVFTLDQHFKNYRKHGRRQIPLIAPWTHSEN